MNKMVDSISLQDADSLIRLSGLVFPQDLKEKMKVFIVKNWSMREGKKTKKQLIYEIDHTCTKEYLSKLLHGDEAHKSWIDQIEQRYKDANETDDVSSKQQMLSSIDLQIEEVSKIFTDGFFNVMKNNLVFNEKGEPISVKEGDDQKRFGQCNTRLTEDDFRRRAIKVGQKDPEAEGVTGKAFAKYGQGKKHKTKKRKVNRKKFKNKKTIRRK